MNPRIKQVTCKDNRNLIITFNNGEVKLFDMSRYFEYPVFEPLKDPAFFNKAHVLQGTVAWNDELDVDPDTLYLEGTSLN